MQIKDKVVVVTGGASGIGKSLCERFAREGAKAIVVSDINQDGIDATVANISASTQALGVKTDVGDEEDVNALVSEALEKFGQIDLFCSNAGIFTGRAERMSALTPGNRSGISTLCPMYLRLAQFFQECLNVAKAIS